MNNLIIRLTVPFFLLSTLIGCAPKYTPAPAFPYEQIKSIAVCPVAIQPETDADGYPITLDQEILGRLAAEEFIKFKHAKSYSVMYPREVIAKIEDEKLELKTKEDVKQLGRLLNVDAICLIQINQFSDFSPKRCSLTFYLFETNADTKIDYSIVNISGFGTPGGIDIDEELNKEVETIAMIQRQWDASDEVTREKAQAWANRLETDEAAKWQSALEIKDDFFRMIFHYTIREYIYAVNELIERKLKPGKHPFVDKKWGRR